MGFLKNYNVRFGKLWEYSGKLERRITNLEEQEAGRSEREACAAGDHIWGLKENPVSHAPYIGCKICWKPYEEKKE